MRVREDAGVVFVMVELGNSSDVPFTVLLTTQDNTAAGSRRNTVWSLEHKLSRK